MKTVKVRGRVCICLDENFKFPICPHCYCETKARGLFKEDLSPEVVNLIRESEYYIEENEKEIMAFICTNCATEGKDV
ncbi:MAG: hypothetical protein FJ241_10965 [Nitrospira sp.]|nr:hypothetical protein [Nitrospira sp.]